jgi:hypothetical protein
VHHYLTPGYAGTYSPILSDIELGLSSDNVIVNKDGCKGILAALKSVDASRPVMLISGAIMFFPGRGIILLHGKKKNGF